MQDSLMKKNLKKNSPLCLYVFAGACVASICYIWVQKLLFERAAGLGFESLMF